MLPIEAGDIIITTGPQLVALIGIIILFGCLIAAGDRL